MSYKKNLCVYMSFNIKRHIYTSVISWCSSLLHEAVPVLYASLAGHSHLSALPSRNGARCCGVSKTTELAVLARIYSKQTLWKLFSQPRLRRLRVVLYAWTLQFTTGHVRLFSIVSLSTTSLHGLMLVRDSKSRCTSDSTLTITCYILTLPSPALSSHP